MAGAQNHFRGRSARKAMLAFALITAASVPVAIAQDRSNVAEPPAQAVPAAPERKPGALEAFGRWMDDSAANMTKGIEKFWRGAASQGDAANKASTEATANIAKGAADAAKGATDALGKLGTSRLATGRERCAVAANGAPDCRIAAETLCKSKGFASGNSVDFETSERCSAQAVLSGRKEPGDCRVEHVVTKAMCQ
jgi:hypothetical protein